MNSLILTHAQAQAICRAMCELNNLSARLTTTVDRKDELNFTLVCQDADDFVCVRVVRALHVVHRETYDDQAAFATAYGIE